MALIDIGPGATDRSTTRIVNAETYIAVDNPANGAGTLTIVELFYWEFSPAVTGVKVGTFYGSGTSYTSRDWEDIGDVAVGSKQQFTGLDIDVEVGDFLGHHSDTGRIEADGSGVTKTYRKAGDQFGAGVQTYSALTQIHSFYGQGSTEPAIYIGNDAINRASYTLGGQTIISKELTCSGNGTIVRVDIYAAADMSGVKVGTFYGTPPDFTCRDYETLGNVAAGWTDHMGLSIDAVLGDRIGIYCS